MHATQRPSGHAPKPPTVNEPPSSHGVLLYVGTIAIAAIVMMVALVWSTPAMESRVVTALGLACFAVAAELLEYRLPNGGSGSVALIPFAAISLVAPDWSGAMIVGMVVMLANLARRRSVLKVVFNTAQAVLAIAAAIHVFRLLGGQPLAEVTTAQHLQLTTAATAFALIVTFIAVNTLTVSAVIALTTDKRLLAVWRDNTIGTASYYVLTGPIAYSLGWVYIHTGFVGAAAVAVPLLGVRQLYTTTLQLQRVNRELLDLMIKAMEARDPYTSGHSRRVADTAAIIARAFGLNAAAVERVRVAALLHDIGKIDEVYAPILRKEGKLSSEEWDIMKTHPARGADLVATLTDLRDLVAPIRHHHEHWDGSGYPDGIAGESIPLAARIITFADTLDAMRSDRPYRSALGPEVVRAEFVKNCGTQFDPNICGHVLSPAVWAQLFPEESAVDRPRALPFRTPSQAVKAAVGRAAAL